LHKNFLSMVASLLLGLANSLLAHQINSSYASLALQAGEITLTLTFDLNDLERVFPLDQNRDGVTDREELLQLMPEVQAYVAEHFDLALGYTPTKLAAQPTGFHQDEFGNVFIDFTFSKAVASPPAEVALSVDFFEKFGPDHLTLAKAVVGDTVQTAVLSQQQPRHRFALGASPSLSAQLAEFIRLGVEHIFLGYDHLMFLLGLIAIGGRFLDLVKIVTSFTLAHSLTLILAALEIVALPTRLIESGIALSIAYVAAENFIIFTGNDRAERQQMARHRWLLTFFFGLVHGFGFANVLRDLGLPHRGLIGSLLSFNLGVELGQMAIVALLFPAVLWLTQTRFQRRVVFALSSIIFVFGFSWFIERSLALSFMPF